MNATLIASVPMKPVSTTAYGAGAGPGVERGDEVVDGRAGVVLDLDQPDDVGVDRRRCAATIFARWRASSAAESAPRQSSVPDGPHGPRLVGRRRVDRREVVEDVEAGDRQVAADVVRAAGAGFAGVNV